MNLDKLFDIFEQQYPGNQIFKVYVDPKQNFMLIHASPTGQPTNSPNTYLIDEDGAIEPFHPMDNIRLYHQLHDDQYLVYDNISDGDEYDDNETDV